MVRGTRQATRSKVIYTWANHLLRVLSCNCSWHPQSALHAQQSRTQAQIIQQCLIPLLVYQRELCDATITLPLGVPVTIRFPQAMDAILCLIMMNRGPILPHVLQVFVCDLARFIQTLYLYLPGRKAPIAFCIQTLVQSPGTQILCCDIQAVPRSRTTSPQGGSWEVCGVGSGGDINEYIEAKGNHTQRPRKILFRASPSGGRNGYGGRISYRSFRFFIIIFLILETHYVHGNPIRGLWYATGKPDGFWFGPVNRPSPPLTIYMRKNRLRRKPIKSTKKKSQIRTGRRGNRKSVLRRLPCH